MTTILHILGTAQREGTAQARTTQALYQQLHEHYRFAALFLGPPGPLADELRAAGIDSEIIHVRGRWDLSGMWRLWRRLRRHDFDLVHQQLRAHKMLGLLHLATNAPVLLHVCAYIAEPRSVAPEWVRAEGADAVVANSPATARWVRGATPDVISLGVPIRSLPVSRRDPQRLVIGCAARLVPAKGLEYLIRSVAQLLAEFPNLNLEIAGAGPEAPRLEDVARSLGVASAVTFLGWCDDVVETCARWDVYAQPSLAEGFGMTAAEAMMAGLPVVATGAGGLESMVAPEKTGLLVPPADIPALALALRRLLLSPALRAQFGQAGRERAEREFSASKMAASFARVYERLLAGKPIAEDHRGPVKNNSVAAGTQR